MKKSEELRFFLMKAMNVPVAAGLWFYTVVESDNMVGITNYDYDTMNEGEPPIKSWPTVGDAIDDVSKLAFMEPGWRLCSHKGDGFESVMELRHDEYGNPYWERTGV